MPYANKTASRIANRERQRRWRVRQRQRRLKSEPEPLPPPVPDPAQAVADWSRKRLVVPPGHPLAGQPMTLPDYGVKFIRDALSHRESLLCIGRKNSKSGIVAVLSLALLAGPLKRAGLRIGTVSLTREKASELLRQMQEIAEASQLTGLDFRRSPAPGWVNTPHGATAQFLSADKSAGHASGFDFSIADELGLMTEKDRDLIAGMRSATSARDGRFIALTIRGSSPMVEEMLKRKDLPTCAVHHYAPEQPETGDVDIHDPAVWAAANPGLSAGIKSVAYMQDEAARVEVAIGDRAAFLAYDLNMPQLPTREVIFTVGDWSACTVEVDDLPDRVGTVCLGIDLGDATSGSAAFAIWPTTGRCEAWLAFGDVPDLHKRGRYDNARYDLMQERGELWTYPGRVTPVAQFMADLAEELKGCSEIKMAADGYKDAEVKDFLDAAGLRWPYEFRRVGAGKDGGRDVRCLQRFVMMGGLKMLPNLAFETAISKSELRRDAHRKPRSRRG